MADLSDALKGIPLWKAATRVGVGIAFTLFGAQHLDAAIAADNARDDTSYAKREEYHAIMNSLTRIEGALADLNRRVESLERKVK